MAAPAGHNLPGNTVPAGHGKAWKNAHLKREWQANIAAWRERNPVLALAHDEFVAIREALEAEQQQSTS